MFQAIHWHSSSPLTLANMFPSKRSLYMLSSFREKNDIWRGSFFFSFPLRIYEEFYCPRLSIDSFIISFTPKVIKYHKRSIEDAYPTTALSPWSQIVVKVCVSYLFKVSFLLLFPLCSECFVDLFFVGLDSVIWSLGFS